MQPAISKSLIQDIRALIEQSHIRVKHSINSEMVLLYWNIGSSIRSEILRDTRAEYGQQVIAQIAKQLQAEYGRGFNQSALSNGFIPIQDSLKCVSSIIFFIKINKFTNIYLIAQFSKSLYVYKHRPSLYGPLSRRKMAAAA